METMQRSSYGLREVKFAPDGMHFTGYGAVFGNVDSYGDVIEPGAFAQFLADAKSGKQPWPAMLSQHGAMGLTAEDMTPIGVWTDMAEDGTGLKIEGELADTPRGREMYALMKMSPRPAIDGLSIGYIPKEWEPRSKPEEPRRRIKRIDLMEVSPVTFPANRSARVASVKSIEDIQTIREMEQLLREGAPFSKSEAVAAIAKMKSLLSGDPTVGSGGPGDPVADSAAAKAAIDALFKRSP